MRELYASGRLIDLILALVVVEAIGLALVHRLTGRGRPLSELAPNLASGAFLLLAVRAALVGADWPWIGACLTGALVSHLIDLRAIFMKR